MFRQNIFKLIVRLVLLGGIILLEQSELKAELLATLPEVRHSWHIRRVIFSSDGRHFAFGIVKDGKNFIVVDGKVSRPYDYIGEVAWNAMDVGLDFANNFRFSNDSQSYAYSAIKGGKKIFVLGNQEIAITNTIFDGNFIFSPNCKQYAYVSGKGEWVRLNQGQFGIVTKGILRAFIGKQFVINAGGRSNAYDRIMGCPVFSPDSKRCGFIAGQGEWEKLEIGGWQGKFFAVIDGQEGKAYENVEKLIFSPDSNHFAYKAKREQKEFVILDGKENSNYDSLGDFLFSPDSLELAYVDGRGSWKKEDQGRGSHPRFKTTFKGEYFVDGTTHRASYDAKIRTYNEVSNLVFSPNSRRLAYIVKNESDGCRVVVDGRESKEYDRIEAVTFSLDSRHFMFIADNKLILDGQEITKVVLPPDFSSSKLILSPDNEHYAYIANESSGKYCIVLDGEKGNIYDYVCNLTFTSDSKYLCYNTQSGQELWRIGRKVEGKGKYLSSFDTNVPASDMKHDPIIEELPYPRMEMEMVGGLEQYQEVKTARTFGNSPYASFKDFLEQEIDKEKKEVNFIGNIDYTEFPAKGFPNWYFNYPLRTIEVIGNSDLLKKITGLKDHDEILTRGYFVDDKMGTDKKFRVFHLKEAAGINFSKVVIPNKTINKGSFDLVATITNPFPRPIFLTMVLVTRDLTTIEGHDIAYLDFKPNEIKTFKWKLKLDHPAGLGDDNTDSEGFENYNVDLQIVGRNEQDIVLVINRNFLRIVIPPKLIIETNDIIRFKSAGDSIKLSFTLKNTANFAARFLSVGLGVAGIKAQGTKWYLDKLAGGEKAVFSTDITFADTDAHRIAIIVNDEMGRHLAGKIFYETCSQKIKHENKFKILRNK